ncbi:MAG: indole-3-glycerol phosphate synthase TrpC [Planctomycetota bacterium]
MKLTFLENVIKYKNESVRKNKRTEPFSYLKSRIAILPKPKKLGDAILKGSGIIAEIKRRSPTKEFPNVINCIALAQEYEKSGASAISVLTDDRYFGGSLADLQQVKACINIPVLRKDFIIDEYQIYQSRAYGADAVLLIAAILPDKKLIKLWNIAAKLGMAALVEVHNKVELDAAVGFLWHNPDSIIGINNRNLATLKVDLNTASRLLTFIPLSVIKIIESGMKNRKQMNRLIREGANGFLIGGTLLESSSPGKKLRELIYGK